MIGDSIIINKLGLFSSDSNYVHGIFYNFNLYAAHFQPSVLTDTFDNNYSTTPVLLIHRDTLDLQWTYNQWNVLVFDSSFKYNGTDNFIFEFQWNGSNGGSNWTLHWVPVDTHRVLNGYMGFAAGTFYSDMTSLQIFYSTYGVAENAKNILPTLNISPNPFTHSTLISYQLSELPTRNSKPSTLCIYDLSGKLIKSFSPIPNLQSPTPTVTWDGKDNQGKQLSNGIYFLKLSSGNFNETKKITIIR